jgi:hypothetical protein
LLADGEHTLQVTATFGQDNSTAESTLFTVANSGTSSPVKMYIDVPNSSTSIAGTSSFSGWAPGHQRRDFRSDY